MLDKSKLPEHLAEAVDRLAEHERRALDEYCELSDRVNKLVAFTKTQEFLSLEDEDRRLLLEQERAMQLYLLALGGRISRFKPSEASNG